MLSAAGVGQDVPNYPGDPLLLTMNPVNPACAGMTDSEKFYGMFDAAR